MGGSVNVGRALRTVLVIGILLSALPSFGQDQQDKKDKKAEQLRTVHGTVVDKDENSVAGSVVYLLNLKTQAIRTLYAGDDGAYRFSGLDPNVDYELHAEHGDMQSSTRTVSSFDSRRDIEITLKLAHKKPAH
jgi:hypothetical protein